MSFFRWFLTLWKILMVARFTNWTQSKCDLQKGIIPWHLASWQPPPCISLLLGHSWLSELPARQNLSRCLLPRPQVAEQADHCPHSSHLRSSEVRAKKLMMKTATKIRFHFTYLYTEWCRVSYPPRPFSRWFSDNWVDFADIFGCELKRHYLAHSRPRILTTFPTVHRLSFLPWSNTDDICSLDIPCHYSIVRNTLHN